MNNLSSLPGQSGLCDPNFVVQHIPIAKNATAYLGYESLKYRWQHQFVPYSTTIARFVILRDPFERYLSAVVADISHTDIYKNFLFSNNQDKANNIFDKIFEENKPSTQTIDGLPPFLVNKFYLGYHTIIQTNFLQLQSATLNLYTFFKMSITLGDDLNKYFQEIDCNARFSNRKLYESNEYQSHIRNKLNSYLESRKKIKNELMEYLQPDYNLLQLIDFHNGK